MSLSRQTLVNGAWQSASVAFQGITLLCATGVLARLLNPEDFGVVATANVVAGLAGMLTRFGFGQALVQRAELSDTHVRVAFTASLLTSWLTMGALVLVAPIFNQVFNNPNVGPVLVALSLSFPFTSLGVVAESLLARELAFKSMFWATLASYTLGYVVIGIGLALSGFGAWALVSASLASQLVRSLVLLGLRPHPKRLCLAWHECHELLRFGGGITLSALLKYVANNGDYFVVGRWLGTAALGVYQQAFNVMVLFARYLGDVLESVLFPAASRLQREPRALASAYLRVLALTNLCLLPTSIAMIVLAPEVVRVYLGPKWDAAVLPARILFVALTFRSQSRISDAFVNAVGSVYRAAARKAVFAATVVLGSWYGRHWGIAGVAVAVTLAMVLDCLLVLDLGVRVTRVTWSRYTANFLPGVLMGSVVLLVCAATAQLVRVFCTSPPLVLSASAVAVVLAVCTTAWLFPRMIGPAGLWLVKQSLCALQETDWIPWHTRAWRTR